MRKFIPALLLGLALPVTLFAEGAPLEVKNDTFQCESDGSPIDWRQYPPPASEQTKYEVSANGNLILNDADQSNGLGVGQWVKVEPEHKYRATLTTAGTGGALFVVNFTPKIPAKMAQINNTKLSELRVWAEAGQPAVLEGVSPVGSTNAWIWIYSPKATKGDCRLELLSVKFEDLGAAPGQGPPANPQADTAAAPKATPHKKRPAEETLPVGTIKVIDFETGDLSQARMLEGGKKEVVSAPEPVRSGKHALKVSMTHDQKRSEIVSYRSAPYGEAKYGWSIYIPQDFDGKTWFNIVTQWHTWGSGKDFEINPPGPPTSLVISKDAWQLKLLYQDGDTDKATQKFFPIGSIEPDRGKWTDFVMEVNWQSPKSGGGYLRLYKNGEKVVDYEGPTWFEDKTDGPYFKLGNYKGGGTWKGEEANAILYFDEFRMAGPGSKVEDVKPGQ